MKRLKKIKGISARKPTDIEKAGDYGEDDEIIELSDSDLKALAKGEILVSDKNIENTAVYLRKKR